MNVKKAILIILTIALLGVLGIYLNEQKGNKNTAVANPSVNIANTPNNRYKDGTFISHSAETYYGPVKIAVVVKNGKIFDVKFLELPDDDARSSQISRDSQPQLKLAAIEAQSPSIDFVTGASITSYGYKESLQAALDQAKMN